MQDTEVKTDGAVNASGLSEANINLKIALKLQNLLEQANSTVILTRSDDKAIYEIDSKTLSQKKTSDIKNRVKIGNSSEADIFISIHLNKFPQSKYYGWQAFYGLKSTEKSKFLAEKIQGALGSSINKENKRIPKKLENVYIAENVEIPLCLVECGFLSNPEEASLLQKDEYQDRLAFGIFVGISNYFNEIK